MTIPTGQTAIILSVLTLAIIPLVKLLFDRQGFFSVRQTETEKILLSRLQTAELENKELDAENERLRADIWSFKEQHLFDQETKARVRYLEQEVLELHKLVAGGDIIGGTEHPAPRKDKPE